ncbi:MAG: dTDP-4-dehydrorhamnose 3,5-epimerase [Flavobacterium sp.]|nr:MAG: dTDP-4-dehydrorhamnose 3,5-epimerase [Flavobacterium sp.]
MKVIKTDIEGCLILEPGIIRDDRGYFMESFNEKTFREQTGIDVHFVQDNQSFSSKGVVRGLHYQVGEHSQSKLVRVITGEVLDVAVDIRPGSPTYGKYAAALLSEENMRQMFIPRGFAHGFLVMSETATFFYKCDNFYKKDSEAGIRFDDPTINIDWRFLPNDLKISEKDIALPFIENARKVW